MTSQRKAGAILSYLSLVLSAVVSFVYVPILLGALTTSEYGVYELIGSLIGYLSVMDLGLSTTLNRFYVKTKVSEGPEALENLLFMAGVIYGTLTAFAVALGIGVYIAMPSVFGDSFDVAEIGLAQQMMVLVIVNCAIVLPGNWFLAVINANERFVFARSMSIVKYLLQVVTVIAVLQFSSSAMAVLAVQVVMNALCVVSYIIYCKGRLHVRARFHRWQWGLVGALFSFSFFILLDMAFSQVLWRTGQVILGAMSGTAAVAVYGIACKLATSYIQVANGVSSVFLPKLTALSVRSGDMTDINVLFRRIGHIQTILVWAVLAGFFVLGQEFVFLWAGEGYEDVYYAALILMTGLSVCLTQNLGISILQAKNKMGFRSVVYILLAIIDVLVSIPVSAVYGTVGCAVVTAVLLLIGTGPVMNVYYRKVIGIDVIGFFRTTLPLLVPTTIAALACWGFSTYVMPGYSWAGFAVEVAVFAMLYFCILWIGGFNDYEKSLIRGLMTKVLEKRIRE